MNLHDLVRHHAHITPDAIAVRDVERHVSYGELDTWANQISHALRALGVQRGDRVAIWLHKSARTVAAMQAVLRLGAMYVPLDPDSPIERVRLIMNDCQVRTLISTTTRLQGDVTSGRPERTSLAIDAPSTGGHSVGWDAVQTCATTPGETLEVGEDDPAYILYTSGSTGQPKGVCLSHRNALAFIRWAAAMLHAHAGDIFANHAPFHCDLSVLDLYVPFSVGASVSLIPEGIASLPPRLVTHLVEAHITVWYSVPSALVLMMEQGALLTSQPTALRAVLFAGEVFPTKYVRQLLQCWPHIRYLNLYGPTETNVCTYYEVKHVAPDRDKPVPIGRASCGNRVWAIQADGRPIQPGEEGELYVSGPTVMLGYWGRRPQGCRPYPTGDIVRLQHNHVYVYVGRRDHMVKVRGHRVDIGEIEAALSTHDAFTDVAVVVIGDGIDARIHAFVVCNALTRPSLLDVKRYCAQRLPRYMLVDRLRYVDTLPRTANGKVDRRGLQALVGEGRVDVGHHA